jgi:hypothetical protein
MKVRAESVWYRVRRANVGAVITVGLMVLSAVSMVLGGGAGTFW